MKVTETIPSVLEWADMKVHCTQHDDSMRDYFLLLGASAVEEFEGETNTALVAREIVVEYSEDDKRSDCDGTRFRLPKGPVNSVASVVDSEEVELTTDEYEIRQIGNRLYLLVYKSFSYPLTITYEAGKELADVSKNAKMALLNIVEDRYKFRGSTTSQNQYVLENGLKRIYKKYKSASVND